MQAELLLDYSKKTKDELIAMCKEKGIKGYSTKNKNGIIDLLENSITNEIVSTKIKEKPVINASPLRYPGGKTRAIDILYSYVIKYFPDKKTILSPFFGGGSFELFMTTKGYTIKANDLFVPLYNFWMAKQIDCDKLIVKIKEKIPVTKERFHMYREKIMTEKDIFDMASSYFIINRSSFSGATLCGGFSGQAAEKRMTESSITKLKVCDVSKVSFTNLDCNTFLENNPENIDSLIYADPPYYIDTYIYGKNGDMHESFNHVKFAETIKKRKDWIISYNDCEYVRNLYSDCRIFEVKWSYGMNVSKSSSEILILPSIS